VSLLRPLNRLALASVLFVAALSQAQVCQADPSGIPIERRLRQLSLDLLGRPPTMDEYRFVQAKGAILPEDVRALMGREEFYGRMKEYHRALLRSNISAAIYNNGDTRLNTTTDGALPLELRGNPSAPLRGRNSTGCDHFIPQDQCDAYREDPQNEPATKTCRDEQGVPLPVSADYSPDQYQCTQLTGATSCADAVSKGLTADKYLYFCDMRRVSGVLQPHACLPNPGNPITAAMTTEVLDGNGRVVAFTNPAPLAGALARLDRCSLTLVVQGGVRGHYAAQTGCIQREGTVMAPAPYWDSSGAATVAMCAIEAQDRPVNPWTMESCETARFLSDRACGCGVLSRRCESGSATLHNDRVAAINEEPLRIADSVLRRDEDYFTLLTTRRGFVNGTLAQLYRQNQSPTVWLVTRPGPMDSVPDVPFAAKDTWVEYTRAENASGVLTTPEWLYRFPTVRSRVNEFWDAFLCKHFAPPAGTTVPPPEDACNRENNLSKRCGCSYCHATIEPAGAHWGRYGERNAQYLDPDVFPKYSAKCRDCALAGNVTCDGECGNYVMQAFDGDGAQSLGLLKTYLYRTPEEEPNIVGGPALLVQRMMQTGDLERCAVRNVWNAFLGRPMTAEEERLYLEALSVEFAAHNHDLKDLIFRVTSTEAYRRID